MIRIRKAHIRDAESISFLGKKTFDQSFGHLFSDRNDLIDYFEETFSLEKIKNSIQKAHNVYWLVLENEIPIGYAKLQLKSPSGFITSDKVCKLQKIYILNDKLSSGIGSKLQQYIFDKAIEEGNEYLWLSVLKSNQKAISFYERNDYKIIGEHLFSIGKENFEFWAMARRLI